jgi:hypothetical protein
MMTAALCGQLRGVASQLHPCIHGRLWSGFRPKSVRLGFGLVTRCPLLFLLQFRTQLHLGCCLAAATAAASETFMHLCTYRATPYLLLDIFVVEALAWLPQSNNNNLLLLNNNVAVIQ